jgi:hypothetical protein
MISYLKTHPYLVLLSCLIFLSCSKNDNPVSSKTSVYSANFDAIWQNFDRDYVFFNYKKIDWNLSYNNYHSQVNNATNYDDFITIIKNMLIPLKDVHVWVKKSNNEFVQPFFPSYTVNWNQGIWQKYISNYKWHQNNSAWGWFMQDSIAYIAITNWNKDQILLQDFDAVMDSIRGCKGIIIDIRMNGGGYGPLAGSIGGRFVSDKFNCGYIQMRNDNNHNDFTDMTSLEYPKRGDWQFTKTIILLIGRGCFSTSEIFAAGMTKLPNCITIGDTTGGGCSNSRQFNLSDGTIYTVSDQLIFDTDKKIIESNGIPPQVKVNWDLNLVSQKKDPVLDYAFNLLKNK